MAEENNDHDDNSTFDAEARGRLAPEADAPLEAAETDSAQSAPTETSEEGEPRAAASAPDSDATPPRPERSAAEAAADSAPAVPEVSEAERDAEPASAETSEDADTPSEDAESAAGDKPADSAKPAAGDKATDSAKPAEGDKAADTAKPAAGEHSTEGDKSAEPATSAASSEPDELTAVSLGLLPENFVSAPSTALHFYAPAIAPLPALSYDQDDRYDDEDDDERDERDDSRDDSSARGNRRRRRRGGKGGGEPRHVEPITEPQAIKGSTRLEAKKQRRRDGREAGRRRSVVTEAEFLARREAVDRQMIVRSKQNRVQIGVLEDKVLVEHYVARNQDASLIGNVYLGRVQNVLPSMEAAFVDIGRGRNAVLYSGEVDWDAVETGNQPRRIELALKPGDKVLVQVTKDPIGHKGARLTSQISLPGRYLVYVPGGSMNGISRKLPDTERSRLKKILKQVLPESSGVIVRTAAEGATEDQLTRDVNRLTSQWAHVQQKVEKGSAPSLLHSEPDLLVKIVRDVFNEDFTKMLIQGDDAFSTITTYLEQVAPDLLDRVERYEGEKDPFDAHRVTEQIEKALDRKVWLPSGGSLVIDRTEAMTVIDVNTGKFVGSGGNLEETVTKNNLEAAEEIVRQLRLRDIGGIIVVDFIDMVLESNRDLVLRRLVECLSRDRTKHQVAEVTSLGLVQMTRKKLGLGLLETFSEACDVCAGRGVIVHHDPVAKHRSSGSSGRRGRGGQGGGPSNGGGNTPKSNGSNGSNGNGSPHVITDGVKSALAQIAKSTIAPAATVAEEQPQAGLDPDVAISLPEGPRAEPKDDRPAKKRRKRRDADKTDKPQRSEKQAAPKTEKEQLLDSVLSALPEPKAPGEGRGRSRRVTTAALTGTAVSVTPDAPSTDD